MKKVLNSSIEAGSEKMNEPRLLGSIVSDMLHSNSPLGVGYRQHVASQENGQNEEQGWHRNTELSVDLKTILRSDRRLQSGKDYHGILRRDVDCEEFYYDEHFTFTETLPWTSKRNPRLFNGKYISITRQDDGTLRPNFKPMKVDEHFSADGYAFKVYLELLKALLGLVGK